MDAVNIRQSVAANYIWEKFVYIFFLVIFELYTVQNVFKLYIAITFLQIVYINLFIHNFNNFQKCTNCTWVILERPLGKR